MAILLSPQIGSASTGPLGLLLALQGCADYKSAGGECPEITFFPAGEAPYGDSELRDVVAACRPDAISTWSTSVDGPELPEACMDALEAVLPFDGSFRTGTVGTAVEARENVIRAFHSILFTPLVDTGDLFGSRDSDDYCPSNYIDYFGATSADSVPALRLTAADYESDLSAVNTHLFRFILERTSEIRFVTGDGSMYAIENGGAIEVTSLFAELDNPIEMAAILIHESRHNSTGFGDGSDHVDCAQGEAEGTSNCDDTMYGSYGAGISYVDAALKGTLLAELPDGTPWLSELEARSLLGWACTYYQNSINQQSGELAGYFGASSDCGDLSSGADEFFESNYGIPAGSISYRN